MEKEDKNQRALSMMRPPETEFFLQWGTRKRLRCVRIRSSSSPHLLSHFSSDSSDPSSTTRIRRKISSRFISPTTQDKEAPCRLTRNQETGAAVLRSENRRGSPEKEERSYTTRGSVSFAGNMEENGKVHQSDGHGFGYGFAGADGIAINNNSCNNHRGGGSGLVWPKLYISLSSKEKEEDFMAMKGCKLPQRPKKRAKVIQRTILLVSPGAWLTDMSVERYEVREKKASKKRPRGGLKAMGGGGLDSDSD